MTSVSPDIVVSPCSLKTNNTPELKTLSQQKCVDFEIYVLRRNSFAAVRAMALKLKNPKLKMSRRHVQSCRSRRPPLAWRSPWLSLWSHVPPRCNMV
jgi:hypothetical protein